MVAFAETTNDVPPEHVLQWCKNLVGSLRHDGVWGIPRSGITFRVDQENKRLVLIIGTKNDPDFIATKHVFRYIGWDVVDR